MVGTKALRSPAQCFSLQLTGPADQPRVGQYLAELAVVFGDKAAIGQKFVALRRIHAAQSDEFPVGEMKIHAWAAQVLYAAPSEHRSHVRLVGLLPIREVLIPIDAKYRPVRRGDVVRSKRANSRLRQQARSSMGTLISFSYCSLRG